MKLINLITVSLVLAAGSHQAQATIITLNYSGVADLTGFGASATSTVSGSLSWDSSASPTLLDSQGTQGIAQYIPLSTTIRINSVDYSGQISDQRILLYDNAPDDHIDLFLTFNPMLDLDSSLSTPDIGLFSFGIGDGTTTMWSGTSLPDSSAFLALGYDEVIPLFSDQLLDPVTATTGRFSAFSIAETSVSVPEPGTFALLGLGLAGMGTTRRKKKV